jgi:hypothetical protein
MTSFAKMLSSSFHEMLSHHVLPSDNGDHATDLQMCAHTCRSL